MRSRPSTDYLQARQSAQKEIILHATETIAKSPQAGASAFAGQNTPDTRSISSRLAKLQQRLDSQRKKVEALDSQLRQLSSVDS